jgi:hypothetical protein
MRKVKFSVGLKMNSGFWLANLSFKGTMLFVEK